MPMSPRTEALIRAAASMLQQEVPTIEVCSEHINEDNGYVGMRLVVAVPLGTDGAQLFIWCHVTLTQGTIKPLSEADRAQVRERMQQLVRRHPMQFAINSEAFLEDARQRPHRLIITLHATSRFVEGLWNIRNYCMQRFRAREQRYRVNFHISLDGLLEQGS